MYYLVVMEPIRFNANRLKEMMDKRGLTAGQLNYMSDVSQPMISLLLNGSRPNVSVVIVAKLANALGCSVDYLVGLTEDATPRPMQLTDVLHELIRTARHLPHFRQDDLLSLAQMYVDKKETDDTQLMNIVLEKINEVGGDEAERLLLDLFEGLRPDSGNLGTTPRLPLQQRDEPSDS